MNKRRLRAVPEFPKYKAVILSLVAAGLVAGCILVFTSLRPGTINGQPGWVQK